MCICILCVLFTDPTTIRDHLALSRLILFRFVSRVSRVFHTGPTSFPILTLMFTASFSICAPSPLLPPSFFLPSAFLSASLLPFPLFSPYTPPSFFITRLALPLFVFVSCSHLVPFLLVRCLSAIYISTPLPSFFLLPLQQYFCLGTLLCPPLVHLLRPPHHTHGPYIKAPVAPVLPYTNTSHHILLTSSSYSHRQASHRHASDPRLFLDAVPLSISLNGIISSLFHKIFPIHSPISPFPHLFPSCSTSAHSHDGQRHREGASGH